MGWRMGRRRLQPGRPRIRIANERRPGRWKSGGHGPPAPQAGHRFACHRGRSYRWRYAHAAGVIAAVGPGLVKRADAARAWGAVLACAGPARVARRQTHDSRGRTLVWQMLLAERNPAGVEPATDGGQAIALPTELGMLSIEGLEPSLRALGRARLPIRQTETVHSTPHRGTRVSNDRGGSTRQVVPAHARRRTRCRRFVVRTREHRVKHESSIAVVIVAPHAVETDRCACSSS